ncbi:MAG: hypothetical protein IPQ07_21575 [Myxococcales bacterium]|nr:hypothetical protein [Myxococcales bacterium]
MARKFDFKAIELFEPGDGALQPLVVLGQLPERDPHRLLVGGGRQLACVGVVDQEAQRVGRQGDRRIGGRPRGHQLRERLALVVDRALDGIVARHSREQPSAPIVDREPGPQRALDRRDELAELHRGDQAS